jgi:chromosome partitioning protein
VTITYRAAAAAAAISLTVDTLRRNATDAGVELERKQVGASMARIFRPADLFEIARWRAMSKLAPVPIKPAVAAIWGPKGGIGKTTISGNLGVAFALQGLRVLIVDLDFQSSLTLSVGYDSEMTADEAKAQGKPAESVIEYHIGNLLPGSDHRQPLKDVVKKPCGEFGPHLIPADLLLDLVDYKLLAATLAGQQSDLILTRWIAEGRSGKSPTCDLSHYDLILFDCPPSKNRLTRAALLASDHVISPVHFEHFSTKALSYLSYVLKDMQTNYGRCPELIVLGNAHDPQRVRSSVHIAVIAAQYGNALLEKTIRRSEDFPRSLDEEPKLPLLLSRPTSPAAEDVREVARLIADRMGLFDRKFTKESEVANA